MSKNEDYKNVVDTKDGEISNDANKKEEINSTPELFNDNENNGMIFDKPDEIPEFDLIPNIFEASQNDYNTEAKEVLISNHQPLSINEILYPLIDNCQQHCEQHIKVSMLNCMKRIVFFCYTR